MLNVDKAKCSGCKLCEQNCPSGAIRVTEGKAKINHSICNNCHRCVHICPSNAIKEKVKIRKKMSVSVKKDLEELSEELINLQKKLSKIMSDLNKIGSRGR
jgi:Fe-S-cluster-containing hydrogenase component 2